MTIEDCIEQRIKVNVTGYNIYGVPFSTNGYLLDPKNYGLGDFFLHVGIIYCGQPKPIALYKLKYCWNDNVSSKTMFVKTIQTENGYRLFDDNIDERNVEFHMNNDRHGWKCDSNYNLRHDKSSENAMSYSSRAKWLYHHIAKPITIDGKPTIVYQVYPKDNNKDLFTIITKPEIGDLTLFQHDVLEEYEDANLILDEYETFGKQTEKKQKPTLIGTKSEEDINLNQNRNHQTKEIEKTNGYTGQESSNSPIDKPTTFEEKMAYIANLRESMKPERIKQRQAGAMQRANIKMAVGRCYDILSSFKSCSAGLPNTPEVRAKELADASSCKYDWFKEGYKLTTLSGRYRNRYHGIYENREGHRSVINEPARIILNGSRKSVKETAKTKQCIQKTQTISPDEYEHTL